MLRGTKKIREIPVVKQAQLKKPAVVRVEIVVNLNQKHLNQLNIF